MLCSEVQNFVIIINEQIRKNSGSTLLAYCPATGDYLDVGAMEVTKWALEKIDRIRRVFLVEGVKNASGGYCLMKWRNVEPKDLVGLGIILNFNQFGRALKPRCL
jgi:hypothetical protein